MISFGRNLSYRGKDPFGTGHAEVLSIELLERSLLI